MDSLNTAARQSISVLKRPFGKTLIQQKYLLLMMVPGIVYLLVICYGPMYGVIIAFQNYNPGKGFMGSPWAGLKYFRELATDPFFFNALRNTLLISLLKLVIGFPVPIVFAILLNEVKSLGYKRVVQTVSYMPYFLSWAFVASFLLSLLSDSGSVNALLRAVGLAHAPITFVGKPLPFVTVILFSDIWKNFGFSSIIYLAVLTSVDPQLYEAAIMDGANRWKRILHISLPSIKPTVVILLILNISGIINANFEQFFLLQNPLVMDWARVINVYTYEIGFQKARFSYGTAVGLFTSLTSMLLLVIANAASRRIAGESIY
jgi:putative aldouronate transport system permease protein